MLIAIDAGNTRIKWGVHGGAAWIDRGALPTGEVARLAELGGHWPPGMRIVGCNVAGSAVEKEIALALSRRDSTPLWLRSSAQACGVRNGYEQPERLGADRWAALIAARGRVAGECLVVCAGTATTVDWLDGSGLFRGGLILPGFDLMRTALSRNTAQLPLADGAYCREPRNTLDAIVSGCLHAQIGAIERMFGQIAGDAICLLTGGAAERIAPHLSIPFELIDNLILEGLLRYGASL